MTFLWAEDMVESRTWNCLLGIVARTRHEGAKSCWRGSQYANVVLHLRFVPTRQDLDKHLIRLSLDAVFGRV